MPSRFFRGDMWLSTTHLGVSVQRRNQYRWEKPVVLVRAFEQQCEINYQKGLRLQVVSNRENSEKSSTWEASGARFNPQILLARKR